MLRYILPPLLLMVPLMLPTVLHGADAARWQSAWPGTDFSRTTVPLEEIISGGPGKDGIPAIDNPRFIPVDEVSDLVMYDRQTESWWQQYSGEAIVGELAGSRLDILPSRLESFAEFKSRTSGDEVLVPNNPGARPYGANPYVGYDSASRPALYRGDLPEDVPPMMRVVAVEDVAFTLPLLREQGPLRYGDLVISWTSGQNSALDEENIAQGADVGNVVVQRNGEDMPYVVTFAFAFHAFDPEGTLIQDLDELNREAPQ